MNTHNTYQHICLNVLSHLPLEFFKCINLFRTFFIFSLYIFFMKKSRMTFRRRHITLQKPRETNVRWKKCMEIFLIGFFCIRINAKKRKSKINIFPLLIYVEFYRRYVCKSNICF